MLELESPLMDGLEALGRMRGLLGSGPRPVFVVLTGDERLCQGAMANAARRAGADLLAPTHQDLRYKSPLFPAPAPSPTSPAPFPHLSPLPFPALHSFSTLERLMQASSLMQLSEPLDSSLLKTLTPPLSTSPARSAPSPPPTLSTSSSLASLPTHPSPEHKPQAPQATHADFKNFKPHEDFQGGKSTPPLPPTLHGSSSPPSSLTLPSSLSHTSSTLSSYSTSSEGTSKRASTGKKRKMSTDTSHPPSTTDISPAHAAGRLDTGVERIRACYHCHHKKGASHRHTTHRTDKPHSLPLPLLTPFPSASPVACSSQRPCRRCLDLNQPCEEYHPKPRRAPYREIGRAHV